MYVHFISHLILCKCRVINLKDVILHYMSIEKPISTIRKAVQGQAEKKAEIEFLDKPELRHITESIKEYQRPGLALDAIITAHWRRLRRGQGFDPQHSLSPCRLRGQRGSLERASRRRDRFQGIFPSDQGEQGL